MRLSHHCFACGADCSRIAARLDDRLGLALLGCPGCGRTLVRRSVQVRRRWRRLWRGTLAFLLLVVQMGFLLGATGLSAAGGYLLSSTISDLIAGRRPELVRPFESAGLMVADPVVLALPLAMFLVVGLWHGITFAHFGLVRSVIRFLVWVAAVVLVVCSGGSFLVAREFPSLTDLSGFATMTFGLLLGSPAFVGASLLGRRAAESRARWRRGRYRRAMAARRRKP